MPSTRIAEFDTWRPGYGGATVRVEIAGTDTLASIFTDENLTLAATNPQILASEVFGGVDCGKFQAPLYIGVAYTLKINGIDETGVARVPLSTLVGEDASLATVQVAGGNQDIELEDHLARRIDVRDFGLIVVVGGPGASASTNNATLVSAMAAASAAGGGYVEVPAGTYQVTTFTVPQGVVVRGQGRSATVLQSTQASAVATIGGSRAGFERITLDGVSLVASSIGVFASFKDEVFFNDAEVKRFETGIDRRGGGLSFWRDLFISTCVTGYKLYGDAAGPARFNHWVGGKVEFCTTAGIDIRNTPQDASKNTFARIALSTNTGIAVKIVGARHTLFADCRWQGNTTNLDIQDASPATADNTVIGFDAIGGVIESGAMTLASTLKDVAFRRMEIGPLTLALTTPTNNVLFEDCDIASGLQLSGVPTSLVRRKTSNRGTARKTTGNTSAQRGWGIQLDPGQCAYFEGKVVARSIDGLDNAFYHIATSARRPGNTLNYDTQTANFSGGSVLTGATSGATARIIGDTDAGATGVLELIDVTGTFIDNEVITDSGGGSALVNGTIGTQNAALRGAVTAIRAAVETAGAAGWDAAFAANGLEIELQVTGSGNVEWTVDVDVVTKI